MNLSIYRKVIVQNNLPQWVIKVVNNLDSSDKVTLPKTEFASSFEKTFAFPNLPKVNSADGNGCTSRLMLAFSLVKSTQFLT